VGNEGMDNWARMGGRKWIRLTGEREMGVMYNIFEWEGNRS